MSLLTHPNNQTILCTSVLHNLNGIFGSLISF